MVELLMPISTAKINEEKEIAFTTVIKASLPIKRTTEWYNPSRVNRATLHAVVMPAIANVEPEKI